MWDNNYRPERQDISNQNFDKYQNYFHPENNMNTPMGGPMYGPMDSGPMGPMNNGPMYGPMDNNQMGPMNNGPMYGPMDNGPMGPMNNGPMYGPMDNGPMGPMNNGPMYGPMDNNQMGPMNNGPMYGPMDNNPMGPMNNSPMYGPMDNNQMGPMNNGPMYGPMNNGPIETPISSPMDNPISTPMYGPVNDFPSAPAPKDNGIPSNITNTDSLFGAPMYSDSSSTNITNTDSLFGAPMYDSNTNDDSSLNAPVGGFDQLVADNMSLKNGEIVNEFPTFEKLNNLNNIATSSAEPVQPNTNPNPSGGQFFNTNPNPMPMNQGFQMNQNTPMNQNRNWTFINNDNNGFNNNMPNNNQANMNPNTSSSFFQKNILDDIPKNKNENNIASNGNIATPTNNKDYYEDMKSGEFVSFSDLNSGKVKEEDTNKYMGVQTEENKPQFDLNLENGSEDESKFDDFYE